MVYFCEAAECSSHSEKKPHIYPFMASVRWVKWPKDQSKISRWKNLMRRADKIVLTRRSRVCSRHFDPENINKQGIASTDPKYFAWNNWGNAENPRRTSAIVKMEESRQNKAQTARSDSSIPFRQGMNQPTSILMTTKVPCVGLEEEFPPDKPIPTQCRIGKMMPLEDVTEHVVDHDYITGTGPQMVSVHVQTDLTVEDIRRLENSASKPEPSPPDPKEELMATVLDSDDRVCFYTGIDSRALLNGVYNLLETEAGRMKYWNGSHSSQEKHYETKGYRRPGPKRQLTLYQEFIMTLMRLRLDLPILILADMFLVSTTLVSKVTITWIGLLHQLLVPALLVWPTQEQVRSRMPLDFKKEYPKTRCVIDCSEFFIDRPTNKKEQYATFSSYKHHNTYKALIAVNPNGCFTYISDLWSGNVSDKYITEHCGIVELLDIGDEVMADRGFQIEEILSTKHAKLVAPPFTRKWKNGKGKRLNVNEIRKTKTIARLRIHVERAIQRIKTFRILKHQIPSSLKDISSMTIKVVAALCNLKGPLFYGADEQKLRSSYSRIRKKPVKRLCKKV